MRNVLLSGPRWQAWQEPRSLPSPTAAAASTLLRCGGRLGKSTTKATGKGLLPSLSFQAPASASSGSIRLQARWTAGLGSVVCSLLPWHEKPGCRRRV